MAPSRNGDIGEILSAMLSHEHLQALAAALSSPLTVRIASSQRDDTARSATGQGNATEVSVNDDVAPILFSGGLSEVVLLADGRASVAGDRRDVLTVVGCFGALSAAFCETTGTTCSQPARYRALKAVQAFASADVDLLPDIFSANREDQWFLAALTFALLPAGCQSAESLTLETELSDHDLRGLLIALGQLVRHGPLTDAAKAFGVTNLRLVLSRRAQVASLGNRAPAVSTLAAVGRVAGSSLRADMNLNWLERVALS